MGFPKAIEAHKANNLVEAEKQYERAFQQNFQNPVLYQNYGSLLVKLEKYEKAEKVYQKGLALFPRHHNILRNYANLLRRRRPAVAVHYYTECIKQICLDEKSYNAKTYLALISDLTDVLYSLDLNFWAYSVLREAILTFGVAAPLLKNLIVVSERLGSFLPENTFQLTSNLFTEVINEECAAIDQISLYFSFAAHYHYAHDNELALKHYDQGMHIFKNVFKTLDVEQREKARSLVTEHSWNFACIKLQMGEFQGWSLFDHGLRAPAVGSQKWQRALTKPFTDAEVPIWRGQSLQGKRLLLLEEQAVGDAMMFFSLVPDLLSTVKSISIFVSKRLLPIYKRTFDELISSGKVSVCSKADVSSGVLTSAHLDYQSAVGSILQYRYSSFDQLPAQPLQLIPPVDTAQKLRKKYLSSLPTTKEPPVLVGISWRGGGRSDRIKQKSIDPDDFFAILKKSSNAIFVSLQYGDHVAQCEQWKSRGVNLIWDTDINPLKDMDYWLAQVSACDAVLSVANTTIHGSGGLSKPTMCLLSNKSDWRWFDDRSVERSYWYPSVGIARQSLDGSWSDAVETTSEWIKRRCPQPKGRRFL